MDRFPHLSDPSTFPSTENVNVYKYPNNFDYSRYDGAQMKVTLCSVPWDLGEAHVGQRTITGVGNVVDFGSIDDRNAYFDGLPDSECYRFTTKYRAFHAGDEQIKVPVPVTALADYNYLEVEYYTEPTAEDPIEYETNRISRWYYFIRDFEQKASNSTLCNLMLDTWQTYIYFVDIPYMYLERGHYPMAKVDADTYLANPVENSEWLQGEEPSFGTISREAYTSNVTFNNGTMYACIVSSGSREESAYGTVNETSGWRMRAISNRTVNGVPSTAVYAMDADDLTTFLANIDTDAPQYKQSIQGVFFISSKLVTKSTEFEFFGVDCWTLATAQKTFTLIELEKGMWDYPEEYADIAKLYTAPYTAIDVYTEAGDVVRINVEDTTGDLDVIARVQLTFPWINIDARLSGYGSGNRYSISYSTINDFTFTHGGLWYETLKSWNVPIYGVIQDMNVYNSFATYWSREQNAYAAENARANANASAETARSNANATASTNLANANAEADTTVANAAIQTAANSNINSNSNATATSDWQLSGSYATHITDLNTQYTRDTVRTENEAEENSASVAASYSQAGGLANGAISGAASGGLIGAIVGGVSGLISGAISGSSSSAQTAIAVDLASDKAELAISAARAQTGYANSNGADKTALQNSANTTNTSYNNSAITSTAANSAALTNGNASRDYSTDTANATRDYNTAVANATRDYNTAISANNNQIREARLGAPQLFGQLANGDTGINRPQSVFATIVKQPTGAIVQAGDMFLRYGYTCNRVVPFEGFNVMPKFTYWQCSDLWLKSSTVPDAYMDQLRLLLFGGVTVWRDPADIGYISIYENK